MNAASLEQARQLHRQGEFARAIALYQQALDQEPGLPQVWHLKGMAEHQAGQHDAALASAARAIEIGGPQPPFLLLEGGVLHDRGDLRAAEERYSRAVAAAPKWAPALIELGSVRMDQGRVEQAVESFRAAIDADPKNVRGWNNLGVAFRELNRLDDAQRAFNQAISLNPRSALAQYNLARLLNTRYEHKLAISHAQAAVQADPKYSEAWLLLGDILRRTRQHPEALAAYKSAAAAVPDNLPALNAMADLLAEMGRFEDARRGYWQLWQRNPSNLRSGLGANLLLPPVYASREHLEIVRREYGEGLELLHAAAGQFAAAAHEAALQDARWTNFYLAYQGRNDRDLQRRYGEFHRKLLAPRMPELFAPRAKRANPARLRVGFLSQFFFNCTAGRYFASWITHLDPTRFEKYVYYTNEWVADDTRRIAAGAQVFRHLPGRSLHAIARQVIADELDVLVYPELGMHAETFALAGLRLAPVQVAGWGHPNTTGLPEIDWFLSCAEMEPGDAAAHYTEKLALLPGLGTRYALPQGGDASPRADFNLPEDRTLYLVPQSLFKIHPDNDDLIARVIAGDAKGLAVFFAGNHDAVTQAFGARMGAAFRYRGLDIQERAVFLLPNLQHARYLRLNEIADVMLDTLHWSGGNTSLDALAGGLPVVTLPGEFMRGRQSQAMLEALGVPELVVKDREAYVDTALRLGTNPGERRALSERIRANRGALFDRDEPIRALEDQLERMFRETPAA